MGLLVVFVLVAPLSAQGAEASRRRERSGAYRFDALLVVMVIIWGVNYSVIKRAFTQIPPQPFNALRLAIASSVFIAAIQLAKRRGRLAKPRISSVFYTSH